MRNNVLKLEKDVACDTETENRERLVSQSVIMRGLTCGAI